MKQFAAMVCGLAFAGAVLAQAESPFADALDESDARIVAAYQAQCDEWAQGYPGQVDGQSYQQWCMKSMPEIWPVGLEAGIGGE